MNEPTQTGVQRHWAALVGFIVLCFGASAIGAFFPPDEWYATLVRPGYAPPNWVFGPVWTVLYFTMAVSGWLVWTSRRGPSKAAALTAYAVQLFLNSIWSVLFFGMHRPDFALLDISLLWLAIVCTITLFRRHSTAAALLLLPYLAWVSFAALLNYGFWSLN